MATFTRAGAERISSCHERRPAGLIRSSADFDSYWTIAIYAKNVCLNRERIASRGRDRPVGRDWSAGRMWCVPNSAFPPATELAPRLRRSVVAIASYYCRLPELGDLERNFDGRARNARSSAIAPLGHSRTSLGGRWRLCRVNPCDTWRGARGAPPRVSLLHAWVTARRCLRHADSDVQQFRPNTRLRRRRLGPSPRRTPRRRKRVPRRSQRPNASAGAPAASAPAPMLSPALAVARWRQILLQ